MHTNATILSWGKEAELFPSNDYTRIKEITNG